MDKITGGLAHIGKSMEFLPDSKDITTALKNIENNAETTEKSLSKKSSSHPKLEKTSKI